MFIITVLRSSNINIIIVIIIIICMYKLYVPFSYLFTVNILFKAAKIVIVNTDMKNMHIV